MTAHLSSWPSLGIGSLNKELAQLIQSYKQLIQNQAANSCFTTQETSGRTENLAKKITVKVLFRENEELEYGPIYTTFISSEKREFIFYHNDILHQETLTVS